MKTLPDSIGGWGGGGYQLHYMQTTDLGYNRSQVLTIKNTDGLGSEARAFKEQLLPSMLTEFWAMTGLMREIEQIWRQFAPYQHFEWGYAKYLGLM